MADFITSLNQVLTLEGRFSNDPNDHGGPTNWGVSLVAYKTIHPEADIETIRNLTKDQALQYYKDQFWKYEGVVSQEVADKLFDIAVNQGSYYSHSYVQLWLSEIQRIPLNVDGIFGPKTLGALNQLLATPRKVTSLLLELRARQAVRYAEIVHGDSTQFRFLLGWMRRAVL